MNAPLWFSNLLSWSVQVALLAVLATLLPRLFRIRHPGVLLAYWRGLVLVSLALPLLQPWQHLRIINAFLVARTLPPAILPAPSIPLVSHWQLPDAQLLAWLAAVVILSGIALRMMILALGLWRLRQFRRAAHPVPASAAWLVLPEQISSCNNPNAEFRFSVSVDSPVTFGLASPIILLPERFLSLAPQLQTAIACHELLHVRRRDWTHHLAEEVLRGVFWFHPAIAWLISRVRLAREQVVDLEVVKLTGARKTYLEALLEFTAGRTRFAAIPAPPFLAERQLVARVALMLKEVRMSRGKLLASLALIAGCLIFAAVLAARTFPLKGAPRLAQSEASASPANPAPLLRRIEIRHHDFDASQLNDSVVAEEQARINQLPGRLKVETTYDQAIADRMKEVLKNFWRDRGVLVEVSSTLEPMASSTTYARLEFHVFQTELRGGSNGAVDGGISGGIAKGVSGDIAKGINGGISSSKSRAQSGSEPEVGYNSIWVDTVKRGPMVRQVRGLGKLVPGEDSGPLAAKITVPVFLTVDVRPNQSATVDTRMGLVKGRVVGVNAGTDGDTRSVYIALDGVLPERAAADLSIDATIDIETLDNVLHVGRPVHGAANSTVGLFKIAADGKEATRVNVKLGRSSVNAIEVLDGLKEGDKIILSDMSPYDNVDRVRLTNEKSSASH